MKFKVGDRVKTEFGTGTIVEINESSIPYLVEHDVWSEGHNASYYGKKKRYGNKCYWFCYLELTLLSEYPEIKIRTDGEETVAEFFEHGKKVKEVYVHCLSNTAELVLNRMLHEYMFNAFDSAPPLFVKQGSTYEAIMRRPEPATVSEKPKYFNGKVICIKAVTDLFTKGKIYEFKDGIVKVNNGDYFDADTRYKSFSDFLKDVDSQFIEVKE